MRRPKRWIVYGAIAFAIMTFGSLVGAHAERAASTIEHASLPTILGCEPMQPWAPTWSPAFVGADFVLAGTYRCEGYLLHVSVVQYVDQRQGKEAVSESNRVIPRDWWNATKQRRQYFSSNIPVDEYRVASGIPLTIWNWYSVGLRPATSLFGVKMFEAVNALRFRAEPTTNITVAVEGGGERSEALLAADAETVWMWFTSRRSAT